MTSWMTIADFSYLTSWIDSVFTPAVYESEWYNQDQFVQPQAAAGVKAVPGELSYVRRQLKIVNGVRIWQARVTNTSCTAMQRTARYAQRFGEAAGGGCFDDYRFGVNNAKAPFGPAWAPSRYKYYEGPLLRSTVPGYPGWSPVDNFGNGGYTIYLPSADDPNYGSQGPQVRRAACARARSR
jgi:hypothetical protein